MVGSPRRGGIDANLADHRPGGLSRRTEDRSIRRSLLPGIEVALVEVRGPETAPDMFVFLRAEDVAPMTVDAAYEVAIDNLAHAAVRGDIPIQADPAPDGTMKLVVWSDDPRAAACLLLPGVTQHLGGHPVFALIPHRDVLVLFRDRHDRASFVRDVLDAESGGPKPITNRLLRVVPNEDRPFWIAPPVAWADDES
jgi:hypothetical protein